MRLVTLIDVDNTLIDNDRAKDAMADGLRILLGEDGTARFWAVYEEVRAELGVVDIPRSIERFLQPGVARTPDEASRKELHRQLASIFMDFPFRDYVFPGVFELIVELRQRGTTVILSDGDQIYQPAKINRSGLTEVVGGFVLVFPHKEEHLAEIAAVFPGDRYLLLEDKPAVIERVTERAEALGAPLTTVLIRQGKYAHTVDPKTWGRSDYVVERIGDVQGLLEEVGEGR